MTQLAEPMDLSGTFRTLYAQDRERLLTLAFTDTLRRQTRDGITAQVLTACDFPAGRAAAYYLDVPEALPVHVRKAVLAAATTGRIVTYAESAVILERLTDVERTVLLEGRTPLGDILEAATLDRDLVEWHCGIGAPYPGGRELAKTCRPGWPIISRTTRLGRRTAADMPSMPLAIVTEYWPAFDAMSLL